MNAYERAARRALTATDRTDDNRQLAALLDRYEEAEPHMAHLQRLHPGPTSTRERLQAAGLSCKQIGLQEDDLEFADAFQHELHRR